jgi:hypothetical protein
MIAAARLPLHVATFALPVSNDDAIPLMMAERIRHGELSTILWNQPYNGTLDAYLLAPGLFLARPHTVFRLYEIACAILQVLIIARLAGWAAGERAAWIAAVLAAVGTPYMALMAATGPTPNFLVPLLVGAIVLALGRRTGPDGDGHENEDENEEAHHEITLRHIESSGHREHSGRLRQASLARVTICAW